MPSNSSEQLQPIDPSMLCNPYTGEPLTLEDNMLVSSGSGQRFPLRNGIPSFIKDAPIPRRNRFYRWFYDRTAFAYDFTLKLGPKLNFGNEANIRREVIAKLPIGAGDKVLETAIGTALNIPHLPKDGEYYGVDISRNMLRRAQSNLAKWNRTARLFHADAQFLPFQNDTFEHVFHMGGLQFIDDPFQAVRELARVAKPGTTITILDEASGARRTFKRLPAHAAYAKDRASAIASLPRLVPHGMKLLNAGLLQSKEFYRLTFRKSRDES